MNMTSMRYAHQRNSSAAEQLIADARRPEEADSSLADEPVYNSPTSTSGCVELGTPPQANDMLAALSDCSSYYGLPNSRNENEHRYILKNPHLRANIRVVIGSIVLTLFGAAAVLFGIFVTFVPNDMDVHGWIFFVVGTLFFIPGFYHIVYITCTLCGRPGYSFDNLPTFSKPEV